MSRGIEKHEYQQQHAARDRVNQDPGDRIHDAPFMFRQAAKRLMVDANIQSEMVDGGRLDDCSLRSPSRTMAF